MNIKYELRFFDYWHINSGLSGGILDNYVVKNDLNLPYVPGKIIKGILREMAEIIANENTIKRCFGDENHSGECFFSNANLNEDISLEISSNNLQNKLYDVIHATRLEKGVAKDHSLRKFEVVIPLSLEGFITDIPNEYEEIIKNSLGMVKRMGLNRNRGLGRCKFILKAEK